MEEDTNGISCGFCSASKAIYTCPRCMVRYCSQLCYKSNLHANCSEQFYKECVEEELKLNALDNTSKNQMLDMLKRVYNETPDDSYHDTDSDDDDSIPDLSERIQNIDLNNSDELWTCLTEQEKQEFNAILNSGSVSFLIPEYEPWWTKKYEKKVEEIDSLVDKEYENVCPLLQSITPFSSLSKVKPSACILWNIVNVLSAYVFTVRRFIGEYHDTAGANSVLILSTNLNVNQNFDSPDTAIESVIYQANADPCITCSTEEAKLVRGDVDKVLAGPKNTDVEFYILAALSDVQRLFQDTIRSKKTSDIKRSEFSQKYPTPELVIDKEKVKKSIKKLAFYLSWSREFYRESMIS